MQILAAPRLISRRSTNSGRLERWLGAANVAAVSRAMNNESAQWYGPPIAVHGVPGAVFATRDGDFVGECREGYELSAYDRAEMFMRRLAVASRAMTREKANTLHSGFASLSDLISKTTQSAQRTELFMNKAGPTGVINVTSTLWRVGTLPQAGAAGSAAPGGRACTTSTTGSWNAFQNAPASTTQHFISANILASLQNTLLLYDRLFDVAKTMSSSSTESVTGTPTRYTNTSATAVDYIGGNFGFIETFAALAAVAHNWTTCLYNNQANSGATMPSLVGNSSGIIDRLDQPTGQWFAPLAAGDTGIASWTQMQCSAATVTGNINFCIGHPIAWIPCPIAGQICTVDGINTAYNLIRIFDNACLAFLEVLKPAATATTYTGSVLLAQG